MCEESFGRGQRYRRNGKEYGRRSVQKGENTLYSVGAGVNARPTTYTVLMTAYIISILNHFMYKHYK